MGGTRGKGGARKERERLNYQTHRKGWSRKRPTGQGEGQNEFTQQGTNGDVPVNGNGKDTCNNASPPVRPNKSTNASISKGKSLPHKYVGSGVSDVITFRDYGHASLEVNSGGGGSKKLNFRDVATKGGSKVTQGTQDDGIKMTVMMSSTQAVNKPWLRVPAENLDLNDHLTPWKCVGSHRWNCRRFAQDLSSGLSSQSIINSIDTDTVDFDKLHFITDWKNLKDILKSPNSSSHLSFFLHRVGNAVTIDRLDLFELESRPGFLQIPSDFKDFVSLIVGENKDKIKKDGRANILSKEVMHNLLHYCMEGSFGEELKSDDGFLHHFSIMTEGFRFIVGADMPLFWNKVEDEGVKKTEVVTVRARDSKSTTAPMPEEALDIWLDNKLAQCSKTLIASHTDTIITGTEWLNTDDLLEVERFRFPSMQNIGTLLTTIHDNVKAGHSYWLYREPGSIEITLYNISNIRKECTDQPKSMTPQPPVIGNWSSVSPFAAYFTTASLMKYADCLCEVFVQKLLSETDVEPNNNFIDAMGNARGGLPNERKKSKTLLTSKYEKLIVKLESQVQILSKHFENKEIKEWIIEDLEKISCENFGLLRVCLDKLYAVAEQVTPLLRTRIYRHAVDRFYPACLKLLKVVKTNDEYLKFWEADQRSRIWILNYTAGICSILALLNEWHQGLHEDRSRLLMWDQEVLVEWLYLGCRICISHADTFFYVILRLLDDRQSTRPHVDAEIPKSNCHDIIINLYLRALKLIPPPAKESFEVKSCFLPSTDSNVVYRKDLRKEILQKLSAAFMDAVRYNVSFPAFLEVLKMDTPDEGTASNQEDFGVLLKAIEITSVQKRVADHFRKVRGLLAQCISYAETSEDKVFGQRPDDELSARLWDVAKWLRATFKKAQNAVDRRSMENHFLFCARIEDAFQSLFFSFNINKAHILADFDTIKELFEENQLISETSSREVYRKKEDSISITSRSDESPLYTTSNGKVVKVHSDCKPRQSVDGIVHQLLSNHERNSRKEK